MSSLVRLGNLSVAAELEDDELFVQVADAYGDGQSDHLDVHEVRLLFTHLGLVLASAGMLP